MQNEPTSSLVGEEYEVEVGPCRTRRPLHRPYG